MLPSPNSHPGYGVSRRTRRSMLVKKHAGVMLYVIVVMLVSPCEVCGTSLLWLCSAGRSRSLCIVVGDVRHCAIVEI